MRYSGGTPNNYISFNNELWRIIGIFNVYNNDTKKDEKLVKIVRNDLLGNYSWDTSPISIDDGNGINEWSQADLMMELNTDYLDITKTSGTTYWYNGENNLKNGVYDYSKNIKNAYIDKIANIRWNLGAISPYLSAINTYNQERGIIHVSNPSDGITRTNTWDGKIGLMYPSDYSYASTDSSCRNNFDTANCTNNNWLFSGEYQHLLSSGHSYPSDVFVIVNSGQVTYNYAKYTRGVRPVLFLKSDIQITSGAGIKNSPYILK